MNFLSPSPIELAIIDWWQLGLRGESVDNRGNAHWDRKVTGVGFFLEPIGEANTLPFVAINECLDIIGVDDNDRPLIGVICFSTDGTITMIEGFCYNDAWPTNDFLYFTDLGTKSRRRVRNVVGGLGKVLWEGNGHC